MHTQKAHKEYAFSQLISNSNQHEMFFVLFKRKNSKDKMKKFAHEKQIVWNCLSPVWIWNWNRFGINLINKRKNASTSRPAAAAARHTLTLTHRERERDRCSLSLYRTQSHSIHSTHSFTHSLTQRNNHAQNATHWLYSVESACNTEKLLCEQRGKNSGKQASKQSTKRWYYVNVVHVQSTRYGDCYEYYMHVCNGSSGGGGVGGAILLPPLFLATLSIYACLFAFLSLSHALILLLISQTFYYHKPNVAIVPFCSHCLFSHSESIHKYSTWLVCVNGIPYNSTMTILRCIFDTITRNVHDRMVK